MLAKALELETQRTDPSEALAVSVEAITWALRQKIPQSSTKFVLTVLANCASGDTFEAHPSAAYLAEATGQDRKTVLSNLAKLRDWGLIVDTGARKGLTGQVVVYRLICTPDLFAEDTQKRNRSEKGTVPKSRDNSTVFGVQQSQKRDTETSDTSGNKERENARGQGDDQLPEGIDLDRWQAYRQQVECDGKLSAPRLLTALGQLRNLRADGVDCNLVLDAAVMRGFRDLADTARRLEAEGVAIRQPGTALARGSPATPKSRTLQAMNALDEVTDRVKSRTTELDHGRAQGRIKKTTGFEP